jgi:hypothetical protein
MTETTMRLKVKTFGPDDWCVINLDEEPSEHNYYGMVAFGFVSNDEAEFYARACEANPLLYPFGLMKPKLWS